VLLLLRRAAAQHMLGLHDLQQPAGNNKPAGDSMRDTPNMSDEAAKEGCGQLFNAISPGVKRQL